MRVFTQLLTTPLSHTARLTAYLPGNASPKQAQEPRTTVLICPGGGYTMTSDREAEPIALDLIAQGFNAVVLRYSVAPAVYPVALLEAAEAMHQIRQHAQDWQVNEQAIVIAGFSAGGHLAANLATQWQRDLVSKYDYQSDQIQPNGLFLGYPVITTGPYAHKGSIQALLGAHYGEADLMAKVSLEKQVTSAVPPTFIWHTATDDTVPVENSLLFVEALRKAQVSFESHVFPQGGHGLSLATAETANAQGHGIEPTVSIWFELFTTWLKTRFS